MNPTVELVSNHKKANMRKSEFLMLEALKSAPHLNDRFDKKIMSLVYAENSDEIECALHVFIRETKACDT